MPRFSLTILPLIKFLKRRFDFQNGGFSKTRSISPKKSDYTEKSRMNILLDESSMSQLENNCNLEYFD